MEVAHGIQPHGFELQPAFAGTEHVGRRGLAFGAQLGEAFLQLRRLGQQRGRDLTREPGSDRHLHLGSLHLGADAEGQGFGLLRPSPRGGRRLLDAALVAVPEGQRQRQAQADEVVLSDAGRSIFHPLHLAEQADAQILPTVGAGQRERTFGGLAAGERGLMVGTSRQPHRFCARDHDFGQRAGDLDRLRRGHAEQRAELAEERGVDGVQLEELCRELLRLEVELRGFQGRAFAHSGGSVGGFGQSTAVRELPFFERPLRAERQPVHRRQRDLRGQPAFRVAHLGFGDRQFGA